MPADSGAGAGLGGAVVRALLAQLLGWPILLLQLGAQATESPLAAGPLGPVCVGWTIAWLVVAFVLPRRVGVPVAVAGVASLALLTPPLGELVVWGHQAGGWLARPPFYLPPSVEDWPCWMGSPLLAECAPYVHARLVSWAGLGLPMIALVALVLHPGPRSGAAWWAAGPLFLAAWMVSVTGGFVNAGWTPPRALPPAVVVAIVVAGGAGLATAGWVRVVVPTLLLVAAGWVSWPHHGPAYGALLAPIGVLSAFLVREARRPTGHAGPATRPPRPGRGPDPDGPVDGRITRIYTQLAAERLTAVLRG